MKTVLVISLIVIIALAIYVLTTNKTPMLPSLGSAYGSASDDLRKVFVGQTSQKISEIAKCVVGEFAKRYSYPEAEKLVNETDFKNNPAIVQILDGCTFATLKHIYMIAERAMSSYCNSRHMDLAVKWIVDNVEYKIHTDEEIKQILSKLDTYIAQYCWTDAIIEKAFEATKGRFKAMLGAVLLPSVRDDFIADKKYDDWLNTIAFDSVRRFVPKGSPKDYFEMIPTLTLIQADKLSDKGFSKILAQAEIVNTVKDQWCKGNAELMQAVRPVPFQLYDHNGVMLAAARILREWCWDSSALEGRARTVIGNIV